MYNPFSLEGKTVLITGASSGIGRATAIECSKCGARVYLTARNEIRLKETVSLMEGTGHEIIVADLTVDNDILSLSSKIEPLDGVVLSAGINDKKLVKFLNEEHIDEMLSVNFKAPIMLVRQLVKKRLLKKECSVVVLSSLAAFFPSIANCMYASTKAALTQFSKVLAMELMLQKIRVNCIEPAFVETDMVKKPEIVDTINEVRKNSPFGRLISPEEVAQAAIFFLSDATKLVTGSELVMDGGFIINR